MARKANAEEVAEVSGPKSKYHNLPPEFSTLEGRELEEFKMQLGREAAEKEAAEDANYADEVMDSTYLRAPDLTDLLLSRLIKGGYTQREIATRFGVAQSTVSRRAACAYSVNLIAYEQMLASDRAASALADPAKAREAAKSLWNAKEEIERNYARLLEIFGGSLRSADRIRAIAQMVRIVESSQRAQIALYQAERVGRFIETSLAVIGEIDQSVRARIIAALATPQDTILPLPGSAIPTKSEVEM